MACNEPDSGGVDASEVEKLFDDIAARGVGALAPIECEILTALRERPVALWCRAPLRLLRCLHAKALGLPWTHLASVE